MRVAAIDIGTNSVHLFVAEVHPDGRITTVEKARTQVMLGSGGIGENRLADDAFHRGLTAIRKFKEAADTLGVVDIHTAATSAVREASNGFEFRKAVKEQVGVHVRAISGAEEGRLIWLGVRDHLDLSQGPALLCDLGGGSTELVLGDTNGLRYVKSLPLGHIRMSERFVGPNGFDDATRRKIKKHVRATLAPVQRRIPKGQVANLVGTSGAIRTLARMATLGRGAALPNHGHGLVLERGELEALIGLFMELTPDQVCDLPGMDARRKDTLAAGAVVVREVMKGFGIERLVTSDRSLRDGLIIDWIERHRPEIDLSGQIPDPKERSIRLTMQRFGVDTAHAEHVANIALRLFDETDEVHALSLDDRDLLRAAALLHDIGHHIAAKGHHKHGQYLLKHIRLYGFTAPDVAVLANIVRYHSRSMPKTSHTDWRSLSKGERERVRVLAGLLKVADALDRTHAQPVRGVEVDVSPERIDITAIMTEAGQLERWSANERTALLEKAFDRDVRVEIEQRDPTDELGLS